MKKGFLHRLGVSIVACGLALSLHAQGMEWVEVFRQDFGGNDVLDPVNPSTTTLSADEIGSTIRFSGNAAMSGVYYLTKQSTENSDWHKGSDHTYPNDITRGYYMRINPNGSKLNDVMYVQPLSGICQGVTFQFSAFMSNLQISETGSKPHLGIGIYSDKEGTTLVSPNAFKDITLNKITDVTSSVLPWQELSLEFQMNNSSGTAYFIVCAIQPETNGFDFAIDDISISVQHPKVGITNLDEFEFGRTVRLAADFENDGYFSNLNNVIYKWYYSADGNNYQEIYASSYTNSKDFVLPIQNFDKDKDNGYYRIKIGEAGSFESDICSIQGDYIVNETKNKKLVHLCYGEYNAEYNISADDPNIYDGMEIDINSSLTIKISITKPTIIPVGDTLICKGDMFRGKTFDQANIYYVNIDTVKSKLYPDCDSLYHQYQVEVTEPKIINLIDADICLGDKYKDTLFDAVGTHLYKSSTGCLDYQGNVIVHPTYNEIREFEICLGSELGGETYTNPGTFTKTLHLYTSQFHCDSVINATIKVTDRIVAEIPPVEICEGDVYTFDGKNYSTPGVHELQSISTSKLTGCDSITKQILVIHSNYSNANNPIDTLICFGSPLFGVIYEEPTTTPILVRDPHQYYTTTGCDSVVYFSLTVLQMELRLKVKSNRNTICMGEQVEIDVANLKPADALLSWNHVYSGTNMKALFTPTEDMTYVVLARNEKAGCEASDTVRVWVRDSPILTIDTVDQRENRVTYHTEGGTLPYVILLDNKVVSDEGSGELMNSFIGMHTLTAMDSTGCLSSRPFEISPIPITPSGYFTPDGDGVNDLWKIENIDVYSRARVRIYARDGKLIQEYNGYDNNEGWDGRYQGHLLPPTDYWYEINLPEIDRQYIGHFTLYYNQK